MEKETDGELVWKGGFTSPHTLLKTKLFSTQNKKLLGEFVTLGNHPIPPFPWLSINSPHISVLDFSSRAAIM
jgi:hypothetical protein